MGIGIFDGKSEQDIRDEANPGATVHIDGKTDSLAAGIHQAALQTVGRAAPTPMEAMQKEMGRLLVAFREAEGRDPDPNADPEFWSAYRTIMETRTGKKNLIKADDGSTPVRKDEDDRSTAVAERIEKALADGSAPSWARGLIERSR
jgi:hypothetical protein